MTFSGSRPTVSPFPMIAGLVFLSLIPLRGRCSSGANPIPGSFHVGSIEMLPPCVREEAANFEPCLDPRSIAHKRYLFDVLGVIPGKLQFFQECFYIHVPEAFDLDQKPNLSPCSNSVRHDAAHGEHVFGCNVVSDLESNDIPGTPIQFLEHITPSPFVVGLVQLGEERFPPRRQGGVNVTAHPP